MGAKLQGWNVLSSWSWMMPTHAVRQAPVEPGMQKITVRLARPPKARDCSAELPISATESARKVSPKPSAYAWATC